MSAFGISRFKKIAKSYLLFNEFSKITQCKAKFKKKPKQLSALNSFIRAKQEFPGFNEHQMLQPCSSDEEG